MLIVKKKKRLLQALTYLDQYPWVKEVRITYFSSQGFNPPYNSEAIWTAIWLNPAQSGSPHPPDPYPSHYCWSLSPTAVRHKTQHTLPHHRCPVHKFISWNLTFSQSLLFLHSLKFLSHWMWDLSLLTFLPQPSKLSIHCFLTLFTSCHT